MNLLPCFVRSRAGLRAIRHQADEGHCPRVRDGAVQRSDGQARVDVVTRECATDAAGGLFLCHYAVTMPILPLKRRTDSAPAPPGAPGLSWGYRNWKGNTVLDGHYEAPFSPQIFPSSLMAFPVRSSLIPIGGALCRLCALCGSVAG